MSERESQYTPEQRESMRQKSDLLAAGGYAIIPHDIYRVILPELNAKYDGRLARDCIVLYGYLHAYTSGETGKAAYLWAYPTVDQIVEDTGIKRNRVKPLADVLEAEGLLLARKIPWNGHTRKLYMPMYRRKGDDEMA